MKKVTVVAIIVAFVLIILLPMIEAADNGFHWEEGTHNVKSGESLWIIAGQYCPENYNRADWIRAVMEKNNMRNETIYPGQTILILIAVPNGK